MPALDNRNEVLSIDKLGKRQERDYLDKVAAGAEDYYSGGAKRGRRSIGDGDARAPGSAQSAAA